MYKGQGRIRIQFLRFQGQCNIFVSESYLAAFDMSENMQLDFVKSVNRKNRNLDPSALTWVITPEPKVVDRANYTFY